MPKWKTEPGAQFVALQRLVAAKEKRLKKLEEPSRQEELIVHGRTVRYPLVLKAAAAGEMACRSDFAAGFRKRSFIRIDQYVR